MFINPYHNLTEQDECQRSSFHTHAGTGPNTCGSLGIHEVLEEYKRLNYGSICISNHNLYTDPTPYQRHGICLIPGYEYTKEIHMVCLGTDKICLESHQQAIDCANNDGGVAILCHPNWKTEYSLPKETIDNLKGFVGVEIYNGSIDRGIIMSEDNSNGRCNAPNAFDYILSQGRLCWCFGNDDFHRWCNFETTWNMIYAARNQRDILNAITEGRFYVSTGLLLQELTLKDDRINIKVRNNQGFKDIYTYRFIKENGYIVKEVSEQNASYDIHGDEMYIRIEVISSSGKMLYTQPIYNCEKFKKEIDNV